MTYLYRAVAVQDHTHTFRGNVQHIEEGEPLGRSSGYLSRTSAIDAGRRYDVPFVIVRSRPVVFDPAEDAPVYNAEGLTA
jgi:hypothetical protein